MEKEDWYALEYKQLRFELNNRVDYLHKTISLAAIFWLVFLIASISFLLLGVPKNIFYTFLLSIPIVIDLVAFNYQSNQNSLESIPRYFEYRLKPLLEKKYGKDSILGWEQYFTQEKASFKYESVTKVFPFVLPSFIPIYFLFAQIPLQNHQTTIIYVDLAMLVLMLLTFRYKLRRVK